MVFDITSEFADCSNNRKKIFGTVYNANGSSTDLE